MDIILDTNIFRNDFFFKSNDFQILKDYLKKTDSSFILPDIILEELKGLYKKTLNERILSYKKACRELNNVLNENISEHEIDVEIQLKTYIEFVLKKLKIDKRKIIPYKNDYLPELVKRAIAKQKPFKDEDKGFRDTIIWLTLIDYCKICHEKQVIFISNNPKDFGDENKSSVLNPQLSEELLDHQIKINYYSTTKDFVESHSKKIDSIDLEWIKDKIDEEWLTEAICEFLNSSDHDFVISWYESSKNRGSTGNYTAIQSFIVDYEDFFIYEMIDDSLIINISVETEAEIEFEHYIYETLYNRYINTEVQYFCTLFIAELVIKNNKLESIEITGFG